MAVQQGRSERGVESYASYVEPLSEARTTLAGFFSIQLVRMRRQHIIGIEGRLRHSQNLIDQEGKVGQA
jgi:hypothetical protein